MFFVFILTYISFSYILFLKGLCGNFNGNPEDDFKSRSTHDILSDPNEFGNQYQTEDSRLALFKFFQLFGVTSMRFPRMQCLLLRV